MDKGSRAAIEMEVNRITKDKNEEIEKIQTDFAQKMSDMNSISNDDAEKTE
jgi:hypothetical protein